MAGSDFRRGGDNEQTMGKLVIGIFLACGEEPRTLLTDTFSGSWEVGSLQKRGRARGSVSSLLSFRCFQNVYGGFKE